MRIRVVNFVIIITLLAAGLAIAEEVKPDPLDQKEYKELVTELDRGTDCIFSRTINDWALLDNKSLILYAPSKNRPYYVSLSMRSFELKFAHTISVYSKFDNRFCPYGGNALFIDGERYTIKAIKKLDKDTAKQLISFNRKT